MPVFNDIPSCGIASLINLETREHYTLYSGSLPIELAKLIESLRKGTHSCQPLVSAYKDNKLTFKLLDEKSPDYSLYSLRADYTEWLKEFEAKGIKNLRPSHKAPVYRIKVQAYSSFKGDVKGALLVYVIAISKRNNKLVLGVFNTMPEAQEWVKVSFSNLDCAVPLFHDGALSREYRAEHGERFVKVKRK
jgi:hypothetical protein